MVYHGLGTELRKSWLSTSGELQGALEGFCIAGSTKNHFKLVGGTLCCLKLKDFPAGSRKVL